MKVTILQCDIEDLQAALLQLGKDPIIIAPVLSPPHKTPRAIPQAVKEEIVRLKALGKPNVEIAEKMGMKVKSIEGVIYRSKKADVDQLDEIAANKMRQRPDDMMGTAMISDADLIIQGMSGQSYRQIAERINAEVGGYWTADYVANRIAELGSKP